MNNAINNFLIRNPTFQPGFHSALGSISSFAKLLKHRDMSYAGDDFLLIVGSGRSGNTLLRKLIVEKGAIYIPPETYVLGRISASFLRNKTMRWNDQVDLALGAIEYHPEFVTFEINSLRDFALVAKKWPKNQQKGGTLIRELYKWVASIKSTESSWVGDKTPLNALNLGLIGRLFPFARYVYIERDPFDVVASYVAAGIYLDYESAADRWLNSKRAWKSYRKQLSPKCYLELKYENLVTKPSEITDLIIAKFAIPHRSMALNTTSALGDVVMRKHHSSVLDKVTSSSIGKGRASIPDEVQHKIGKKLNKEAERSGYQPI